MDSSNVIHAYSAAQAVEDGVLVEPYPDMAREAGYMLPVVLTRQSFEDAVEWTRPGDEWFQDANGRFWDVLIMARAAARAALQRPGVPFGFKVARIPNKTASGSFSRSELPIATQLIANLQAYDFELTPCLVISLRGEN